MKKKIISASMIIIISLIISNITAKITRATDFPVFYRAAVLCTDSNTPNELIYSIDSNNQCALPEFTVGGAYIYSMAASYSLAPLALMPYFTAKTIFIFINIIAYLVSVAIILCFAGASGRWFLYPFSLSIFFYPFFANILACNINSVLLLLVTMAFFSASQNHPVLSGILIAAASLFKLFPIAIAMALGIKNWRIPAACAFTLGISSLIPGSLSWFSSISNVYGGAVSGLYGYFNQYGFIWFWLYVGILGAITAITIHNTSNADYFLFASLSLPTMFLVMPVIEYYHFTLLILPYIYLTAFALKKNDVIAIILLCISIVALHFNEDIDHVMPIQFAGLFILWLVAFIQLKRYGRYLAKDARLPGEIGEGYPSTISGEYTNNI